MERIAELIRRFRFPAFVVLGVIFVVTPMSDTAGSVYLFVTFFGIWALPRALDWRGEKARTSGE